MKQLPASSCSPGLVLILFKVSRSKCFCFTADEHWTWLLLITRTCRTDKAVEVLVQTSWYDLYKFMIRYDSDPVLQFWSLTVDTDVESLPVWTNIWILDIHWSLRRWPHDTWTGVWVFVSWPASTEPLTLPPWVRSQRVSSWTEPLASHSTRLQSSSPSFYSNPNVFQTSDSGPRQRSQKCCSVPTSHAGSNQGGWFWTWNEVWRHRLIDETVLWMFSHLSC